MQLFFAPELHGDQHTLNEQESKHCIKVLRLRTGDHIHLTDGRGNLYLAELTDENSRACSLKIIETITGYGKRPYHIHLAVAPTKNINRFEWFLEKATEIGVDEITPLICQRSERRMVKTDRLNKVITAALKQSIKAYHPILNEAKTFKQLIGEERLCEKYIAYVEEGEHPLLQSLYSPGKDVLILIGPEGDFSPEEIEMARANGFHTVSLGDSRLRTETAAIVACNTVALLNQEKIKGRKILTKRTNKKVQR